MKRRVITICEFGLIRSLDDYPGAVDESLRLIHLSGMDFESLYKFVASNQEQLPEADKPFSLSARGHRRQISLKNFVGTIETSSGLHLDILPKIHLSSNAAKPNETKRIFLKMLRHLKNSPFVQIGLAHLELQKDFSILEVFVSAYLRELGRCLRHGMRHEYRAHEDNLLFQKGKLKIAENIRRNHFNLSKFYCNYSEFSIDNSLNRILKATLNKLFHVSRSSRTLDGINKLLTYFKGIDVPNNISGEFNAIDTKDKSVRRFSKVLDWSRIFLQNRSFTNFSGNNGNLAILFPMERIFEDYLAYLFTRYSDGHKIKIQDRSYFLVERHLGVGKFGLRPDIVLEGPSHPHKIVDAKWKLLDQSAIRRNYNISIADIYQLYAYGKKYSAQGTEPVLILLYPANASFREALAPFFYESNLRLKVIPFDFTLDERTQIEQILNA